MDKVKASKGTDIEKYEWLTSGDKNTNELLPASFQEIGNPIQIEVYTGSFLFNWSGTKKSLSPLIISKFFWQCEYEIANSKDDKLESFIAESISQVQEVEYILLSKIGNHYEIWIVINKLDREVRDRIYDVEYDILEQFSDTYFDFHVVCRDDRNIEDIFPTDAIIFYRRKL
ncbi:MAG: hypothetical protein M0P73_09455 [Syntrophobacterales bacterium]|jgi:hypothetical protein|nr:hypothetical protein [Syntrophobacterales bacterium]